MTAPIDSTDPRVQEFFTTLLRMAGGQYELQAPVSADRDLLDAFSHAVNVIVGEMNLVRKEVQAADRAKSRFLANISHEIRTPIAVIMGFVELLEQQGSSSETKTLARIKANGEHLLALIDQMLDISAIEADRLTLKLSVVEPVPMIESVADGFRERARRKGIDFSLAFRAELPRCMEADAEKVKQVVSNLMSNAVKFTDNGGVCVTVERSRRAEQPLVVQVKDTGPGIPETVREVIFEPFERGLFQGRVRDGAGLGLSIARRLAAFMAGSVELVASDQEGSVFRYTQPVVWREKAAIPSAQAKADLLAFPKTARILVAEDSDDFRSMLEHILKIAGAEVTCVGNGEEAVDKAQASRYDLIVLDVMMPLMNGLDAAKRLREHNHAGPLVALSALAMPEQQEECRAAGFDLVLAKPISASDLIRRLSDLL